MNAENQMRWLQEFLDEAAAEGLCVARNCTTCGSRAFSLKLLRAVRSASGVDRTARGWTSGTLGYLAGALARLPAISQRDEPAVRTMIMRLYDFIGDSAFEDDFAPGFHVSAAGEILRGMRRHYAALQIERQDTSITMILRPLTPDVPKSGPPACFDKRSVENTMRSISHPHGLPASEENN